MKTPQKPSRWILCGLLLSAIANPLAAESSAEFLSNLAMNKDAVKALLAQDKRRKQPIEDHLFGPDAKDVVTNDVTFSGFPVTVYMGGDGNAQLFGWEEQTDSGARRLIVPQFKFAEGGALSAAGKLYLAEPEESFQTSHATFRYFQGGPAMEAILADTRRRLAGASPELVKMLSQTHVIYEEYLEVAEKPQLACRYFLAEIHKKNICVLSEHVLLAKNPAPGPASWELRTYEEAYASDSDRGLEIDARYVGKRYRGVPEGIYADAGKLIIALVSSDAHLENISKALRQDLKLAGSNGKHMVVEFLDGQGRIDEEMGTDEGGRLRYVAEGLTGHPTLTLIRAGDREAVAGDSVLPKGIVIRDLLAMAPGDRALFFSTLPILALNPASMVSIMGQIQRDLMEKLRKKRALAAALPPVQPETAAPSALAFPAIEHRLLGHEVQGEWAAKWVPGFDKILLTLQGALWMVDGKSGAEESLLSGLKKSSTGMVPLLEIDRSGQKVLVEEDDFIELFDLKSRQKTDLLGVSMKKETTANGGVYKEWGLPINLRWSPDGARVLYQIYMDNGGIFVIGADGAGKTRLVSGTYYQLPQWSPRGDKIGCVQQTREGVSLYQMKPDGNGLKRMAEKSANFAWFPDQDRLLLERDKHLFIKNLGDGSEKEIGRFNGPGPDHPFNSGNFAISPDGGRVAYTYNVFSSAGGASSEAPLRGIRIRVYHLADGATTDISPEGAAWMTDPQWSSDGTRLLCRRLSKRDDPNPVPVILDLPAKIFSKS